MDIVQSSKLDYRKLVRRALDGESLVVEGGDFTLHDLTQIAIALQAGAHLAIRHANLMSPIERASLSTAAHGRIVFL